MKENIFRSEPCLELRTRLLRACALLWCIALVDTRNSNIPQASACMYVLVCARYTRAKRRGTCACFYAHQSRSILLTGGRKSSLPHAKYPARRRVAQALLLHGHRSCRVRERQLAQQFRICHDARILFRVGDAWQHLRQIMRMCVLDESSNPSARFCASSPPNHARMCA